jgi:tetratricopeptide (TPR) repeat protein
MQIRIPFSTILYELFPEAQGDRKALLDAMRRYYTVRGVEPEVSVEGDDVLLRVDAERIMGREKLFRAAVDLCEKGRYPEGREKLLALAAKDPTHSEYHRMLGQVAAEMGEPDTAIDHLIDALRWDPKNKHALTMMGNIWARDKQDMETALKYYEAVLVLDPKDHLAANNVAVQYLNAANFDEAESWFQKALEIEPEYANAHHGLALVAQRKGDLRSAFFSATQAMVYDPDRNDLYKHSLKLAWDCALALYEEIDAPALVQAMADELAQLAGKPVQVVADEATITPAKLEVAEVYDRTEHIVRYKPEQPAAEHLVMHELYHLRYILEAREDGVNMLFTSGGEARLQFHRDQAKYRARLIKEGIDGDAADSYLGKIFEGMNRQVFNAPLDLCIEYDIFHEQPDMRPAQFLSMMELVATAIHATTDKRIVALSPPDILSKSKVYSLTLAMLFRELYGVDRVADLKATRQELKQAQAFFDEYTDYRTDREPGEEYELVEHWAKDLQLNTYFKLVPEQEHLARKQQPRPEPLGADLEEQLGRIEADPLDQFANDPEREAEMRTFLQSQEAMGLNSAVLMFMVDALQHFKDQPTAKIRETAFEIALLGTQGIEPGKQGYKLNNVPGKSFSGNHLLAYYYVSWKLAIPEMLEQLQLPFDREYAMAEQFNDPK